MINRVVLTGRLTKDPELRYTPSGVPITRMTLAVNRKFGNQQGERESDFIMCIAWRKTAETMANFLKKGSLIGVEGRIQTGSYEGQDGKRVYTTDVIVDDFTFLEPRSDSQNSQNTQQGGNQYQSNQYQPQTQQQNYTRTEHDPFANSNAPIEVSDDDLPF